MKEKREEYKQRFELLMNLLEGYVKKRIMEYYDGELTKEKLIESWEDAKKKFFPLLSRLSQFIAEDSLGNFSFEKMIYHILKTYEKEVMEVLGYDNI